MKTGTQNYTEGIRIAESGPAFSTLHAKSVKTACVRWLRRAANGQYPKCGARRTGPVLHCTDCLTPPH